MKALRFTAWGVVFLGLCASFFIIFRHGPSGFTEGVSAEKAYLRKLFGE